jgi:hypothetical protein
VRPALLPAALLAAAALVAALALADRTSRAADEDEGPLDYRFYKARVAPILAKRCAPCHADPRKRRKMGRFFLRPAPGRRMRERFQERNFAHVVDFVEPGDPSASPLLLKAIGLRAGGSQHGGGAVVRPNSADYGTLIDWIDGKRLPEEVFRPPETPAGQPDFLFFYKKVEPVLLARCVECHGEHAGNRLKLLTHPAGEPFPLRDHYENFQRVLKMVVPGEPMKSRFLLKPLAVAAGGLKHRGREPFAAGSDLQKDWERFIRGERGPPLPSPETRRLPRLDAQGATIQAEDFQFEGDVDDAEAQGAQEFYVARPGPRGGRLHLAVSVQDAGAYVMRFRVKPGEKPASWSLDDGPAHVLPLPAQGDLDADGFAWVGSRLLLDGAEPLVDARGDLTLEGHVLRMDGRREPAAWLCPGDEPHSGCSARLWMADEETGGDDALLLFDMMDGWNGKFAGLVDGGRRLVMGVFEGGRMRVLKACDAPPAEAPKPPAKRGPRELKVETFGGVAVASLDGSPLLFLNLGGALGHGRFGVLTHGIVEVRHAAALQEYEVHAVHFAAGSVVYLPAGTARLEVDLPAGSGDLDAVRFEPSLG